MRAYCVRGPCFIKALNSWYDVIFETSKLSSSHFIWLTSTYPYSRLSLEIICSRKLSLTHHVNVPTTLSLSSITTCVKPFTCTSHLATNLRAGTKFVLPITSLQSLSWHLVLKKGSRNTWDMHR